MFNRKSISLIAVLAALGVLSVSVTSAGATVIKPPNEPYTAVSKGTNFATENGAGLGIPCEESVAKGQVPGPNVPFYRFNELAGGSVIGPVNSLVFTGCEVEGTGLEAVVSAEADTLTAHGDFTLPEEPEVHPVAVNLPREAATISVPAIGCVITVGKDGGGGVATSAMGQFDNNEAGPSTLTVKSQLPFDANAACGLTPNEDSQAVFFANGERGSAAYTVTGDNGGHITIE